MIGNYEDMIADFNNGTFNFCVNGKCIECGECCSNILPMNIEEIATIKEYIKKHNIMEQTRCNALTSFQEDFTCPFMDFHKKTHKCLIYEVRPKICRDFCCDPKQRKPLKFNEYINSLPVNVREVFYGNKKG